MPKNTLISCLRYEDAPAAIEFLCRAFGFEKHAVYADPENPKIVHHAQLVLDGEMIMLGSGPSGGRISLLYAVVADPEAHHARAVAAGATIVGPPHDNVGYPGRSYATKDTEGNEWSFGTYDPWNS